VWLVPFTVDFIPHSFYTGTNARSHEENKAKSASGKEDKMVITRDYKRKKSSSTLVLYIDGVLFFLYKVFST
jgi:hypothetical protein